MGIRVEKDVRVPMRDGVTLATDLWIPEGGPAPTLLVRLPYGKDTLLQGAFAAQTNPEIFALLEAGYAVVWQDCRGSFRSPGEFTPFVNEPHDGADTIAWLRQQPWCDGAIGTYGPSYLGFTQWASASQAPEGLRAIVPTVTTTDYYRAPWYSDGGALSWHTVLFWTTMMALYAEKNALAAGAGDPTILMDVVGLLSDPRPQLDKLPVSDQPLITKLMPWWSDWIRHPDRDMYWQDVAVAENFDKITVPALHIGGWFDLFVNDTVRSYTRMKNEGGSIEAREGQRLLIGPWDHICTDGVYPDRQFGITAPPAASEITDVHIRFYDRWLRGRTDALADTAPVRIFVMGIDQWRDEQDWPLIDTQYTEYFLDSDGHAHTSSGDGLLSAERPTREAVDTYSYDPANPVPSIGGRVMLPAAIKGAGPADQRSVESRDDVLCFTTPELDDAVEVTGHISLILHVSSSARDTDFTGKLVDVFPDGRALYLTDGIMRARYRNSLADPESLEPEKVYEITLDLSVTSNVFLPGHRIRLEVSSSNFPRYDRNTNTGGVIAEDTNQACVVAVNRILHGPNYPSRLILPIIRR